MKKLALVTAAVVPVLAIAATVLVATGTAKPNAINVNVGAAAFTPGSSNTDCGYLHRSALGISYSGSIKELLDDCDYVAQVDLPDGVRIRSITAYYNDAEARGTFAFQATDDVGGYTDLVRDYLDGSAGGAVCDASHNCSATWFLDRAVNNETTHYGIDWEGIDSNLVVYRFKIKLQPV
jgi:hypothetical protein